ncbi:MAG: hypothetical protein GY809_04240, partial [Planctomycetes bacterium]|nr:hypothetical protein [Planctomycetota bacterium]
GAIAIEDYSNFQMTLRFLAGALGVPFLPTRSGMGSDILARWGFSQEARSSNPKMPDKKAVVVDNPFGDWAETAKVVLVPAIQPDVTIIHAQKAATDGTVRINGLPFTDVEQAKAAERVIVTCEELVAPDDLRDNADLNTLPPFCVDAVCHVPHGAYPTACYKYYDYDPVYLKEYAQFAHSDEQYQGYLEQMEERGESQLSLTDPDSRSMPKSPKAPVAYNVQTAVDSKHHLIATHEVTNATTDRSQLSSIANKARTALDTKTLMVIADPGYYKGEEIVACYDA